MLDRVAAELRTLLLVGTAAMAVTGFAVPMFVSPTFAGALLATGLPGLPLIICGVLKITYDLALLYFFRHIKPPEEER